MFLAVLGPAKKGSPSSVLEDLANTLSRSCRALEVVLRPNLVGHSHTLGTSPSK